jgi:hypothetical protein
MCEAILYLGEKYKIMKEYSLSIDSVLASAARAYARAGSSLAKYEKMYSMDIVIPVSILLNMPDVPDTLKKDVASLGEVHIKAKEC